MKNKFDLNVYVENILNEKSIDALKAHIIQRQSYSTGYNKGWNRGYLSGCYATAAILGVAWIWKTIGKNEQKDKDARGMKIIIESLTKDKKNCETTSERRQRCQYNPIFAEYLRRKAGKKNQDDDDQTTIDDIFEENDNGSGDEA